METGLWVYQFTDQMQSDLKQMLVKRSKQEALSYLQHVVGVASVQIVLSNNGNMMPTNPNDITLIIQKVQSAQTTITPTGSQGTQSNDNPTPTTPPGSPLVVSTQCAC